MKYRLILFTYAYPEILHMSSETLLKSIRNVSVFSANTLLSLRSSKVHLFFILAYPGLILHEGIPSLGEFTLNPDQHKLLIFDDMSIDVENSKETHDLCVGKDEKYEHAFTYLSF